MRYRVKMFDDLVVIIADETWEKNSAEEVIAEVEKFIYEKFWIDDIENKLSYVVVQA